MPITVKTESDWNQEPGTQSGSPVWVAGTLVLELYSVDSQGVPQQDAGLEVRWDCQRGGLLWGLGVPSSSTDTCPRCVPSVSSSSCLRDGEVVVAGRGYSWRREGSMSSWLASWPGAWHTGRFV